MQKPPENWHLRYARYVLLRSRDCPCPEPVRAALVEMGNRVSEVHNPLAALEELCAFDREQEPRRRNNIQSSERVALLVVEPGTLEELPDLYRVLRHHLPEVDILPIETTEMGVMFLNITKQPPPAPEAPAPKRAPEVQQDDHDYGHLKFTGMPEPTPQDAAETPEAAPGEASEAAGSEPKGTESSSGSNPEDPPQRTLTEEERDRLHGRFDTDGPASSQGEE